MSDLVADDRLGEARIHQNQTYVSLGHGIGSWPDT
jgi:hypothetical protein